MREEIVDDGQIELLIGLEDSDISCLLQGSPINSERITIRISDSPDIVNGTISGNRPNIRFDIEIGREVLRRIQGAEAVEDLLGYERRIKQGYRFPGGHKLHFYHRINGD